MPTPKCEFSRSTGWRLASALVGLSLLTAHSAGCEGRKETSENKTPALNSTHLPLIPGAVPNVIPEPLPGLHNLLRIGPGVISGSQPEGPAGFASLAKLGVKTIVSVDGARPDLESAHEQGLRYVHIPIGYAGIPEAAGQMLANAARNCDEAVYVHCHHGKHRGPAAVAVLCLAKGIIDREGAFEVLELAGTGKEYAGLWRAVELYTPPPLEAEFPPLVETAEVASLAGAMAVIDRHWDHLKLCRAAEWQTPLDRPDLVPRQVALLLREEFQEAARTLRTDYDEQFTHWLNEAAIIAAQMEQDLVAAQTAELGQRMTDLENSCKACHTKYRN